MSAEGRLLSSLLAAGLHFFKAAIDAEKIGIITLLPAPGIDALGELVAVAGTLAQRNENCRLDKLVQRISITGAIWNNIHRTTSSMGLGGVC